MTVAGAEAPRREDQTDEEDQFANPLSTFDQGQGEEAEQLEPALALFETTLEIQKKLLQVVSSTVSEMGWRSLFERRSLRMGILVVDFGHCQVSDHAFKYPSCSLFLLSKGSSACC